MYLILQAIIPLSTEDNDDDEGGNCCDVDNAPVLIESSQRVELATHVVNIYSRTLGTNSILLLTVM